MELERDLGERYMDTSHDWKSDGLDFTSLSPRQYQNFIEKNKSKNWNRKPVGDYFFHKLTPSQSKVLKVLNSF